ncbi:MAG: histidinol-phosphate transaminase [Candidatus Omnitrophica bacterium]|nr:histidinol-phosphate transaminase [Candidatus Omnitrophota bacterium]
MSDLISKAKSTVLTVKPYVPGKPIDEVKRELGLQNVIKLASNENPYPPSPKVLKALQEALPSVNRYPNGDCHTLREELSKFLNVKPAQLIFGNGSDELIVLAVRLFVREGDEVIIAQPSFLVYDIASKIAGADIVSVPLKDFHYDLDAMQEAVTPRTRIIFLGNPDNPAGTYLTQRAVEEFLAGVPRDVLVFIDEAYFEYVQAEDYVDSLGLLDRYPNLIVSRTFSKMYGLAGLRVGYAVGGEELCGLFNRIREPFNVNSMAQAAAVACLQDQAYYRDIARQVEEQRRYLYIELTRLNLEYRETYTNFIMVKVSRDAKEMTGHLMRLGVIVRDMSFWGMNNYIRVSIGTAEENRTFVAALEKII